MENVEIREGIPGKGKGLFAKNNIEKGQVLFSEKPLVCAQFLWNALYKYKACDHCLRALETAQENVRRLSGKPGVELPHLEGCETKKDDHVHCPHCMVEYCCSACRDEAWATHHQTLCTGASGDDPAHPLNRLQEAWRNMHYPPETSSIMLVARMIASVKQSQDKAALLAAYSQFCKNTTNEEEQIAHKLLGKEFEQQLELLRELLTEAVYEETVQQWFSPEGFRSLLALIGTNGQGIGSSSFSKWVANCEKLDLGEEEKEALDDTIDQLYDHMHEASGHFLNNEGSGLYRLQSTCNHSCDPNGEVTFPDSDSTLTVVSLADIKAGDEISICYLDECDRGRSRHSRQAMLRENYLFQCSCTKCESQAEDPDVTSDEDMDEEDEEDST